MAEQYEKCKNCGADIREYYDDEKGFDADRFLEDGSCCDDYAFE